MNSQAQSILNSFDSLPDSAKHEVALEILRRTKDFPLPPLSDEELVATAEAIFINLDQRELSDAQRETQ